MTDQKKMREEFEATLRKPKNVVWAIKSYVPAMPYSDSFDCTVYQAQWEAWQASRSQADSEHKEEIARLRKEVVYAEHCALAQTEHAAKVLEEAAEYFLRCGYQGNVAEMQLRKMAAEKRAQSAQKKEGE